MNKNDFISLLKEEMKPALGVTEPSAVALASAKAYEIIGGDLNKIKLTLDSGLYKNCYSCAIPGTDKFGIEIAALLGVLVGKPELELEVLKEVKEEDEIKAKKLQDEGKVEVKIKKGHVGIYVDCIVITDRGYGRVLIQERHSNITLIEKNNEVLYEKKGNLAREENKDFRNIKQKKLIDLVNFVQNVSFEEIKFVLEAIKMNKELAQYGKQGSGMKTGVTLFNLVKDGILANDIIHYAQILTGYAMDARLGGIPKPAMSISGSGSHGIIATMPIVAVAEKKQIDDEKLARSIALSFLITIYIKEYSGRLSAFCGCAIAGGIGASSGIVYLLDGNLSQITYAINNIAGNITGMICDGGNYGCALKAITAANVAVTSAIFALNNIAIPENYGIVGSTPEETIKNIGKIASPGMLETENVILDIMLNKNV
ncbi:L-cysteine desulfidase [Keratinibaculum paraultunense]|uniref:UPF0597 protein EDD65_101192 n=1 Tax=Keratinibaculum paraultunense TaxID=1278232 RepID=A0A4R3L4U5_9FIRM|nr:L-serine ammonia-lyase, iron-sulfur-dependent, subunit alpha [Keratinibaculum paraultunense]QQY79987.1 serine dehydratase subunit alpha family protein [Keratinibaculum paraultunense]TCS91689.1 L-cysteine desulfidase [Keratinibaculum paraultunense]